MDRNGHLTEGQIASEDFRRDKRARFPGDDAGRAQCPGLSWGGGGCDDGVYNISTE